jgi:hypothetical protein
VCITHDKFSATYAIFVIIQSITYNLFSWTSGANRKLRRVIFLVIFLKKLMYYFSFFYLKGIYSVATPPHWMINSSCNENKMKMCGNFHNNPTPQHTHKGIFDYATELNPSELWITKINFSWFICIWHFLLLLLWYAKFEQNGSIVETFKAKEARTFIIVLSTLFSSSLIYKNMNKMTNRKSDQRLGLLF